MTALLRALDRHWFEPGSLRDLAIVRMVLAAATWYFVIPREYGRIQLLAGASDALYQPLPALKLLLLPLGWGARPSYELLMALFVLAHAAALFSLVGLFSRISIGVLAYTVTVVVTHAYSYGELHHPQTLVVIMLWVLAVTPIGHTLSLDAVIRRWKQAKATGAFQPDPPEADSSIHARWPLRLGQWLLALAYLSAAASKLEGAGLGWMNGTTLAYYLAYDGMMWQRPLGVFLAQIGWLMLALSVFTILFEGTFWAAIVVPRTAWLYISAGIALHIGIYLAQRAPFFTFMALYIVFLPQLREDLSWIRRRLAARRLGGLAARRLGGSAARPEPVRTAVVYDGLCPLCIRTMAVVDMLDGGRRLEYVDLEADWAQVERRAPGLTRKAALAAMHVVTPDGRTWSGFDGFRALAGVTPALLPLAPLLYLPPVPPIGRRIYGWVAARRPRRLCRDACEL